MVQFFGRLFDADFLPHGHCFLWQPAILWLHAVSDALIAASYFAIPAIIIYFTRWRRDLPFPAVFLLFAAFILSCGATHVMGIVTLWEPVYRLDGAIKALTATFSVLTALVLVPLVPRALALPSPAQWEAANRRLREEIAERQEMEAALRRARNELEARVLERTAELVQANDALRREVADRARAEEQLRQHALRLENLHAVDRGVLAAESVQDIVGAALARIHLFGAVRSRGGRLVRTGARNGTGHRARR